MVCLVFSLQKKKKKKMERSVLLLRGKLSLISTPSTSSSFTTTTRRHRRHGRSDEGGYIYASSLSPKIVVVAEGEQTTTSKYEVTEKAENWFQKSSPVDEKRTVVRASAGKDSHVKSKRKRMFSRGSVRHQTRRRTMRDWLSRRRRGWNLQRVVGKREYKRHGERGRDVGNVGEELRDDGE